MTSKDPRAASGETPRRIGLFTTDVHLVVTSWDGALASMTGIDSASAVGRPLVALVPDLEARGLLPILEDALETGAAQVLAPALHGYLIPCPPSPPSARYDRMQQRVVLGALREEDRTVGLVVTIEDVTGRLEREHELAEALRQASPAARLRTIERLVACEPVEGIGPLGQAMGDEDWQVRRSAVRALAGRRDASLVDALVSALREGHRNFSVLSSALQLLTMTGLDLTSALVDLLKHPDADLRIQAALALGTQTRPDAAEALLGALDDPDANVRFHAIEALGKLSPPSAVERLAAIAESHDFFLAFPALDALARINDPTVAPRVVPLLRDDMVAGQAAEALGQIGDEDVVPPLVAALDAPAAPVDSIVGALAAIHRRYQEMAAGGAQIEELVRQSISEAGAQRVIDAAATASGASLRDFVVVLGWLRGDGVQRALTLLLGRTAVHHELIEAIVRFGSPMVDRLIAQLGEQDLDTRRAAVIALGRIGDARAVPALLGIVQDRDRELLVPVSGALARLGDARAFEPLLELLGDADVSVRHAAIGALNSIGHADMGARMLGLLGDPDPTLRESAVRIAGYFGYRLCAERLLERCTDPDESVRAAALEHAAYMDDQRAQPVLTQALAGDTPRARAAAAQALGHLESTEALEALRRAVGDGDSWVRYFSVTSLGRQRDVAALPMLERIAMGDDLQHVRIAAVDAIGRIGKDGAPRVLGALAEAEESEVALAALRALGQLDAAAALEPLRRALAGAEAPRRAAAAAAIAQWGREPAVELLAWTAAADGDAAVCRAAIDGLSRIGGSTRPAAAQAIAALAAVAADTARQADAVAALSRVAPPAIPWVGECLSSRDPRVRRAVVDALGRLSHPAASAYVRNALEDGDASVRQQAVVVLSRLGTRGLARTFATLAQTDPSEGVKRAAGAALRRGHDGDASDAGARA